jgi:hypothetical protein
VLAKWVRFSTILFALPILGLIVSAALGLLFGWVPLKASSEDSSGLSGFATSLVWWFGFGLPVWWLLAFIAFVGEAIWGKFQEEQKNNT